MRKSLILLALASVAAMVACNKTQLIQEPPGADAISFRPLMNSMTKAVDNTLSTLQANGFYVLARYNSGSAAYFSDTHYTWNSTSWITATPNYWPSDDTAIDFYAYAPAATGQITGHDAADNYKTFVVTPSTTVSEQVDFIFAYTENQNKTDNGSGVALTFRHAESKVIIKLKNSNANQNIWVSSVSLANIKGAGTYAYTGESESKLEVADWSVTAAPTAVYTQAITGAAQDDFTTATAAAAGDAMVLIPQTLTTAEGYASTGTHEYAGACIKVNLKVQNKAGGNWIVGAASGEGEYVTVMWPLAANSWAPGMAYTYTVDLAGGGYAPVDPTPGDGGAPTPVINPALEISFLTPTVDTWTDAAGIAVPPAA